MGEALGRRAARAVADALRLKIAARMDEQLDRLLQQRLAADVDAHVKKAIEKHLPGLLDVQTSEAFFSCVLAGQLDARIERLVDQAVERQLDKALSADAQS